MYARLLRPPFIASPSPKDPICFYNLTQRSHIFHKIVCCHPKPPFFQKNWHFDAKWSPIFEIFRNENIFSLQIWSYFHRKVANISLTPISISYWSGVQISLPIILSITLSSLKAYVVIHFGSRNLFCSLNSLTVLTYGVLKVKCLNCTGVKIFFLETVLNYLFP